MNETGEVLQMILLNRACHAGEGIIRVAANQTNRANNENQNNRQHNGIAQMLSFPHSHGHSGLRQNLRHFIDKELKFGVVSSAQRGRTPL